MAGPSSGWVQGEQYGSSCSWNPGSLEYGKKDSNQKINKKSKSSGILGKGSQSGRYPGNQREAVFCRCSCARGLREK